MVETGPEHAFYQKGWFRFPFDEQVADWVRFARPAALAVVRDPGHAEWLRCGGTWFAGVNVLSNGSDGSINGSGPLSGTAISFLHNRGLPTRNWDAAQISVIYPGYPKPGEGEAEAAFRFRRDRDAAHVDGLLLVGPDRRRMLREPHAFVLGLPLSEAGQGASPLVIWDGSHEIIRRALTGVLAGHDVETWKNLDITDAYHAARREIFETCARREISAKPGEAYVIHRLALHGVAPWAPEATAAPEGRMIAYFRPEIPGPLSGWLNLP